MRKYKLNQNYFKYVDSEKKAYILGFIFADGNINKNNNNINITIHHKDIEILENIISEIYDCDRPIKYYRGYARLVISSKEIVNDIIRLGCVPNKTHKIKFPDIPDQYIRDFIRGYFDGDGSVFLLNDSLNISIVGTEDFLNDCQKILIKECDVNETKLDIRHPERNNNIRSLRYGGNIIINRIFHYLYDNSNICLSRKKDIYLSILKDKKYFKDIKYTRKSYDKHIKYRGTEYTKTELSEILSKELKQNKDTIRRKLTIGWSIDEIKSIKLNKRRQDKLKTVILYDENLNYYDRFESIKLLSTYLKSPEGSIYQAIKKKYKHKNYYIKYE